MKLKLFESNTRLKRPRRSKQSKRPSGVLDKAASKQAVTILAKATFCMALVLFLGGCQSPQKRETSNGQSSQASSLAASIAAETANSEKTNRKTDDHASQPISSSNALENLTPGQFKNGIAFHTIHYSLRLPEHFDSKGRYPLFVHLPGYEGEWRFGSGANLQEDFLDAALGINDSMIIASLQLNGWDEQSGMDTNELVESLVNTLPINPDQVYLLGYSGGGESGSVAVSQRPDLYSAFVSISSKWDGNTESVAKAGLPIAFGIAENDTYYGSEPMKQAMEELRTAYAQRGFTDRLYFEVKPDS